MTIATYKPKINPGTNKGEAHQKNQSLKFKVGVRRSWIPSGIFRVIVVAIEKKSSFKDKQFLQFLFEVADGDYRGVQLRGFCNANYETFSQNTKLYQWYVVVAGDELEPGDELDVAVFYNKVIEAKVEERISRKTENKFSNVTELIRVVHEL